MEHVLATWGYLAIFVIVLVSSMGIPVGSEVATAYAGVLSSGQLTGSHDHLVLAWVIVVGTVGELAGSTAGYLVGRFGGRPLVDHLGRYVLLSHRDLDRAEAWFARRGEPFVLVGRFIPLLRSFVSVAAGLGEMRFGPFAVFTVLGCGIWNAGVAALGYSLGSSWHHMVKDVSDAGYVLAAAAAVAIAAAFVQRVRQVRAEHARTRAGTGGPATPTPGTSIGLAATTKTDRALVPEARFVTSSRAPREGIPWHRREAEWRRSTAPRPPEGTTGAER